MYCRTAALVAVCLAALSCSRTITDSGPHDELMKKLGTYRRLYELQFIEVEQKLVASSE